MDGAAGCAAAGTDAYRARGDFSRFGRSVSGGRRFRGQTPTSPLRLQTRCIQQTTHEPYRLDDRGDGLVLQALVRDEWQPLYEFSTVSRPPIDLKVGSWFVSTHPSSHFVTGLMAATVTDDARWNLTGRILAVHRGGRTEKTVLEDAVAVVDTLSGRFGINVADLGERSALEARIDQVCFGAGEGRLHSTTADGGKPVVRLDLSLIAGLTGHLLSTGPTPSGPAARTAFGAELLRCRWSARRTTSGQTSCPAKCRSPRLVRSPHRCRPATSSRRPTSRW